MGEETWSFSAAKSRTVSPFPFQNNQEANFSTMMHTTANPYTTMDHGSHGQPSAKQSRIQDKDGESLLGLAENIYIRTYYLGS